MSSNTIKELEKKLERITCEIIELYKRDNDKDEDRIIDLEYEQEELEDVINSLKEDLEGGEGK